MMHDLSYEMVVRLLVSTLLGGLIGLEREVHGRPAGFRTHLLVSLGSCLFVLASLFIYHSYGNFNGTAPVGVDPGRIAAQVVTGIGFLGAGAIIREKASIRGLTTAACLWVAAAVGLASGVGMYVTAVAVTILSLLSLLCLKKVERIISRDSYAHIKIWAQDTVGQKSRVEQYLKEYQMQIVSIGIEKDVCSGHIVFEFEVKYTTQGYAAGLIDAIGNIEGVTRIRIE